MKVHYAEATMDAALPAATMARADHVQTSKRHKVAYIMSRFPKITETFILYEMLAVQQQGVMVEVYPLQREKTAVVHPEAHAFVARAHFVSYFSLALLAAHLYYILRQPFDYFGALWTLLRENVGSRRYFIGALGLFPKAVFFARHMRREGVSHIHAHFASHPAAAAYVIHRLTAIPYSFTAHGSDLHRDRHMLAEKVDHAALVVSISNYNRQIILNECRGRHAEKVKVVHCGVDASVFQPRQQPTPFERGEAPFALLCIGTLHEVKGQRYLVEACRMLAEQGIPVACHFAGDGPDLEMLTTQARQAGVQDMMHFHGRLTRLQVVELLQNADVVVAPSVPSRDGRREGIPVALMEAMAAGVPVIGSDLSGIPELIEDGVSGLLAPPGNSMLLCQAILRLVQSPELRGELAKAGRQKVVQEFDLYGNAETLASYFFA